MSIIIYYHKADPGGQDLFPHAEYFENEELLPALARAEQLRKAGATYVCIAPAENSDHIGKPGVSAVENGKTPDGESYDWRKRR